MKTAEQEAKDRSYLSKYWRYFVAKNTLRIARNWMLEAAKDLENLPCEESSNKAGELRGAAKMINEWRESMPCDEEG